jgi:hypothetical protein
MSRGGINVDIASCICYRIERNNSVSQGVIVFNPIVNRMDFMLEIPERKVRREINTDLTTAGWLVQNRDDLDLTAGRGVVVREFPMKDGGLDGPG